MPGVVVGLARGDGSSPALTWGSAEACVRGLALTVVHAWDTPVGVSVDLDEGAFPGVAGAVRSCAVPGPAAAALLATEPELLVLGSAGSAAHLSRLTRVVVLQAACPVVVVHGDPTAAHGRVVVGVDGTAASLGALHWAAQEARLRGAELAVVHAWQLHPASVRDVVQPGRAVPLQRGVALARLRDWVAGTLGELGVELLATHGAPLDALLQAAASADLLVVGRGSHRGMSRVLHGAVDREVGGLSPCPVAVIPWLPSRTGTRV